MYRDVKDKVTFIFIMEVLAKYIPDVYNNMRIIFN